jgi:tetratricopeptide (TPR) repeat protein
MREVQNIIGVLAFSLTFLYSGLGQTHDAWIRAAEASFESKDYFSALSYYSEAIQFERDLPTLHRSAESARLFDAYSIAESYYAEIIEKDDNDNYPKDLFYLAQMKQRQGKYEDARVHYQLFVSEYGDSDEELSRRAIKEIEACSWAQIEIENPKKNITIEHLENGVNTPYSEFGAIETDNGLHYSSLRFTQKEKSHRPSRIFSRNLLSSLDGISMDTTIISADTQHIAHTAFNGDQTKMYYTLCEYLNDKDIRCDIYVRHRERNGSWTEGAKLPEHINTPGFSTTQPNLTYDSRISREILYYVSDKPGGKGKTDIWYTIIDASNNYSQPMNLSGINTAESEYSPFFHQKTNTLYFSSDGYLGLGGYDIYKSDFNGEGWGEVKHMGVPLNSSFHDVYFTLGDDNETAHFSSNRQGALYLENQHEACCFDIYNAQILPCDIDLHAYTFDADTRDSLAQVTLIVIDIAKNDTLYNSTEGSNITSHYIVPIECDREYRIIAHKTGYDTADISFLAPPAGITDKLDKLIFLNPSKVKLEILTFDRLSDLPLNGCTVRLFDLTTGEVITSPPNMDGNDFTFDISKCHRYEVIASKQGYTQSQEIFDVPCDENQPSTISKKLYLTPSLLDMLPLYLYFDNDRPNPKTYNTTTNTDYSETFVNYFALKNTFVSKYAEAYENVSGTRADVEMTNFFDNQVKVGHDSLLIFLKLLEQELAAGRDYDIILKGYASPRASSSYNKRLCARRIDCVKNEFIRYNNGVLRQYINNRTLRISEANIGEDEAPPGVSDDINDVVNSVFSPEASRERRVEIVDVKKVER